MLVKDQLRLQMEKLGVSTNELATRLQISQQSVRHWLTGRNLPGKRKAALLEKALSFKLDYSEGSASMHPTLEESLDKADLEMFRAYSRLPDAVKVLFSRLAEAYGEVADDEHHEVTTGQRELTVEDIEPFVPKTKSAATVRRYSPRR